MDEIRIGQVVVSIAGRDKGSYFIISKILENGYVEIIDGKYRKLSSPKKKKIKHLKLKLQVLTKIAEKIENNQTIFDSEIRSGLKAFNLENK